MLTMFLWSVQAHSTKSAASVNKHKKCGSVYNFCTKNNYILSNLGYCSEYNTMGNVIQEHYYAECTEHDVPCPSFYNSAESYKCKFRKICKRYAWTDFICGYMFI